MVNCIDPELRTLVHAWSMRREVHSVDQVDQADSCLTRAGQTDSKIQVHIADRGHKRARLDYFRV